MALLKEHHLPFGISTCYTSRNYADITSEEFFDSGALFVWFFHYMPVGNDAAPQLLPTPEQRKEVYYRIREFRQSKAIFSMDFQNDAEYVGGCIAGGRNYLHINAKGDVEPCVFIHYSNRNIHDTSLLDALKSPIFMAYLTISLSMKHAASLSYAGKSGGAAGHGENGRCCEHRLSEPRERGPSL